MQGTSQHIKEIQEQVKIILDTDLEIKYQIAVSLCNYIQLLSDTKQGKLC